jgi:thiamine-phosphate pyrophosphorylase
MYTRQNNKKLVVISPPQFVREEQEMVCKMIDSGLQYFHVRKPVFTKEETKRYLKGFPPAYRRVMILHDHYELADPFGLAGIHITQKHRNKGIEARFIDRHVSISTHSTDEIADLAGVYQYALLSPIFNSISKKGYCSGFTKKGLKSFFASYKGLTPVLALGGIQMDTIPSIQHIGFNGYAVLGAIWGEFSHESLPNQSLEAFKQLKNLISTA